MNLSKKGKLRLKQYLNDLKHLQEIVSKSKPANDNLLQQIASLKSIFKSIAKAYDFTFEASLLANSGDFVKNYNIVNGGDGSWAIALSDDNSLQLAMLTKNLFEDFKNNLSVYVDGLPEKATEIKMFGIKVAYNNPKSIIDSAICQIQGAIQFYNYLGTEKTLVQKQSQILDKIPTSYSKMQLDSSQIHELIQSVCQIPSSFLRNSENRNDYNIVTIMPKSTTGALGYVCQLALDYYLESYAHAKKLDQPIMLADCIKTGSLLQNLCIKLNDFILFADRFAKEDHAEYKQKIIATLTSSIRDQLKTLATKERLECFYNHVYSEMYIESHKLCYYFDTKQQSKISQQREVVVAAITKYLDKIKVYVSQEQIQKLSLRLNKLAAKQNIFRDDLHDFIIVDMDRNFIRETLAITPTLVVHKLMKDVSALNLEHVDLVKQHMHALGETGDRMNDLYSYLLTAFSQFTMAEEPYTAIKFKLMDNLILAMEKEISLSLVESKLINTVAALKMSGGSPLHKSNDNVVQNQTELKPDELTYEANTLK